MTRRTLIGLAVLLLAYLFLIPGIFQPMLTLTADVDKARLAVLGKTMIAESPAMVPVLAKMLGNLVDQLQLSGTMPVYEKTRSIAGTVSDLFRSGNPLVGFLVMLFSVLVPLAKGTMLAMAQVARLRQRLPGLQRAADAMSKWSMADVFVVAIVVAYMAANASADMADVVSMQAQFRSGFYWFLGYCLLSIASAQLLRRPAAATVA